MRRGRQTGRQAGRLKATRAVPVLGRAPDGSQEQAPWLRSTACAHTVPYCGVLYCTVLNRPEIPQPSCNFTYMCCSSGVPPEVAPALHLHRYPTAPCRAVTVHCPPCPLRTPTPVRPTNYLCSPSTGTGHPCISNGSMETFMLLISRFTARNIKLHDNKRIAHALLCHLFPLLN